MIVGIVKPRTPDPFAAVLTSSEVLKVSDEQKQYIRWILDKATSDSFFAQKAYNAIVHVLTVGSVKSPVVTSLTPSSVILGSPSFDIHVRGTDFAEGSKIIFNGFEEPTTRVSGQELTTGVNMPLWEAPAVVPIQVMSPDGVISNSMNFEFLSSGARTTKGSETKPIVETKPPVDVKQTTEKK